VPKLRETEPDPQFIDYDAPIKFGHWQYSSSEAGRSVRKKRMRVARELGTHTAFEWELLKATMGWRCVCCAAFSESLEKDHILPIRFEGSSDTIDNLQPLCTDCHRKGPDKHGWISRGRVFESGAGLDFRPIGWKEAMARVKEALVRNGARYIIEEGAMDAQA